MQTPNIHVHPGAIGEGPAGLKIFELGSSELDGNGINGLSQAGGISGGLSKTCATYLVNDSLS
jgi:hypothetical protein